MTGARGLVGDRRGSSAAEFALVLPVLMVLLFVVIDGGRYLWSINRLEKATQWGTRYAAVTAPVAGGLAAADYVGVSGLAQGDVIPPSALGLITCGSTACACTTAPCPTTLTPFNQFAFDNIVARMQKISPEIAASNVNVTYRGSGLGYAGDPSGMQVAPMVTVTVSGLMWQPLSGFTLKNAGYPSIEATLSAEDSVGNSSY